MCDTTSGCDPRWVRVTGSSHKLGAVNDTEEATTRPADDRTVAELARIYSDQLESFAALADSLSSEQWALPSPCPGWTVADVVAHVIGIELELHGEPLPDHEPDWENLPHVATPVDRYIELPIDFRRRLTPDELLAELHETVEWRREDLSELFGNTAEPAEIVRGPGGWQLRRDVFLKTRIFDVWIHTLDIQLAIDSAWQLDPAGAVVTTSLLLAAMPKIWAKRVGAPVGSSVGLEITDAPVPANVMITVDPDGRARFAQSSEIPAPTSRVSLDWPSFILQATGRQAGREVKARELAGDPDLARAFFESMTVTF